MHFISVHVSQLEGNNDRQIFCDRFLRLNKNIGEEERVLCTFPDDANCDHCKTCSYSTSIDLSPSADTVACDTYTFDDIRSASAKELPDGVRVKHCTNNVGCLWHVLRSLGNNALCGFLQVPNHMRYLFFFV